MANSPMPRYTQSINNHASSRLTHPNTNWCSSTVTSALSNTNPAASGNDLLKQHLESLRARLGFARFKMNQGWESSTLPDVEQLWKEKQRRIIKELPRPRFTQRDVIDKRVFIHAPGAKSASRAAKKAKLVRTYSGPSATTCIPKTTVNQSLPLYFHHYNHQHQPSQENVAAIDKQYQQQPLIQSKSTSDVLASPPAEAIRNSLDYLSYAIAMTENTEAAAAAAAISSQPLPDTSEIEPDLDDSSSDKMENDDTKSTTQHNDNENKLNQGLRLQTRQTAYSPPSSPVTSAAKAIMMIINQPTTGHTGTKKNLYSD